MKAVLAESYEKIHKDHLIGIGIAPLQFLPGESADSLGLSGRETFSPFIPVFGDAPLLDTSFPQLN